MKDILKMSLDELRIEVAALRERCAQLESRLKEPLNPHQSFNDNRCSECGLDLSKPMGYVCSRMDCKHYPRFISSISKII